MVTHKMFVTVCLKYVSNVSVADHQFPLTNRKHICSLPTESSDPPPSEVPSNESTSKLWIIGGQCLINFTPYHIVSRKSAHLQKSTLPHLCLGFLYRAWELVPPVLEMASWYSRVHCTCTCTCWFMWNGGEHSVVVVSLSFCLWLTNLQSEGSETKCFHHCQSEGSIDCLLLTMVKPSVHVATLLQRLLWHLSTYVATNHSCYRELQMLTDDAQVQATNMGM